MKVQEWQVYVLKTEFEPCKNNWEYETKLEVRSFKHDRFECLLSINSYMDIVFYTEDDILRIFQPMLEDKRIVSPVYKQGKEAFIPGR